MLNEATKVSRALVLSFECAVPCCLLALMKEH